jgi:AmmeMemoRadiSam system protein B
MPSSSECPQLRRGLAAAQDKSDPRYVIVWDEYGVSPARERLTRLEFLCAETFFDGQRTLREIQAEVVSQLDGQIVPLEIFTALARRFEDALFLDGPRFRQHWDRLTVREPTSTHWYDEEGLHQQLEQLFTGHGGPGLPGRHRPDPNFVAVLVPHMDYARGGVTYGWGFKEVAEKSPASLFVIVGTSHYSPTRFTLTRKDFKTPLGVVPTDQGFLDRLVSHYGDGLFDDELTHVPEHSVELEVAVLQHVLTDRRPFRIVPFLVGSFHDAVATGVEPKVKDDIARMIEALRRAHAETEEPVCYLISGDLAHLGPKFGDRRPAAGAFLERSRVQDEAILSQAETADAAKFYRIIADEEDRRRICGLSPTYLVLEALRPARGRRLHYQQYVHPRGQESVSFASMAFYR